MKIRAAGFWEGGFTLVEVLVSLAVFSLVFLTLFSSFDAFVSSARQIRAHQAGNGGTALDIMTSDLLQVFVSQAPQYRRPDLRGGSDPSEDRFRFYTREEGAGGKTFPVLSFTSLSPVGFSRSPGGKGVVRITYYVHEDETGGLDLHRADRSLFCTEEEKELRPCSDPVLARDIVDFELGFKDAEGEVYNGWDSEDEALDHALPGWVSIRIGLNRNGVKEGLATGLCLPVERPVDR